MDEFVDHIRFLGAKQHQVIEDGTGFTTKFRQDLFTSKDLNFPFCTLSAAEVKAQYPDYWTDQVETKIIAVQQDLGFNTMAIIFTSVCVVFMSSVLLLSLSKRSNTPKHWVARFSPLITLLECLPLFNFCTSGEAQLVSAPVAVKA